MLCFGCFESIDFHRGENIESRCVSHTRNSKVSAFFRDTEMSKSLRKAYRLLGEIRIDSQRTNALLLGVNARGTEIEQTKRVFFGHWADEKLLVDEKQRFFDHFSVSRTSRCIFFRLFVKRSRRHSCSLEFILTKHSSPNNFCCCFHRTHTIYAFFFTNYARAHSIRGESELTRTKQRNNEKEKKKVNETADSRTNWQPPHKSHRSSLG